MLHTVKPEKSPSKQGEKGYNQACSYGFHEKSSTFACPLQTESATSFSYLLLSASHLLEKAS